MQIIKTLSQAASSGWVKSWAQRYNTSTGAYEYVTDSRGSNPSSSIHQLTRGEGCWIQAFVECELLLPSQ
jgi:hypothetical protein